MPEAKRFGTLLAFFKRASTAAIMSVFSERKSLAEGTEGWGSGKNGFVCRFVAIGIFASRAWTGFGKLAQCSFFLAAMDMRRLTWPSSSFIFCSCRAFLSCEAVRELGTPEARLPHFAGEQGFRPRRTFLAGRELRDSLGRPPNH